MCRDRDGRALRAQTAENMMEVTNYKAIAIDLISISAHCKQILEH